MKTTCFVSALVLVVVMLATGQPVNAQQAPYPGAGPHVAAYPGQAPQAYSPGPYAQQAYMQPAYGPQSYATQVAMLQGQPPRPENASGSAQVDNCCDASGCCDPRWRFFGDFLFLRPRNAEVAYAAVINGPLPAPAPIQVAPIALVDPDYTPAFRVGFGRAIDVCTSVGASFTHFESQTAHAYAATPGNFVHSLVSHPGTASAATPFLTATANYGLDFDLIDLDYRGVLTAGDRHIVNYLVGGRYAGITQDFRAQFLTNNAETVNTASNFDGGGIRIGLEGERYSTNGAWMVYGRGSASFVGGSFRSSYTQDDLLGARVVDTAWTAGRLVTMLDLEVGVGWVSSAERLRCSIGYMVSGWYNVVKTDEWIDSVRRNNFVGLGDTLSFDGLTARAELRF